MTHRRRHRSRTAAPAHEAVPARLALRLDRALEACWLAAAVLVPLVVLPEQSFISITQLPKVALYRTIAGAALILLAARHAVGAAGAPRPGRPGATAASLVLAAVAVLAATALSTALSISPSLSVWGKEPGNDGYGLYNTTAHIVLFAAVALGLRTPAQMWRLVGAVVLAGTLAALVGIAQHWGLSPFGISGTAGNRVTGPAGNPIFLGALLVLTLPLALGAVSAWAVRRGTPAWWWAGAGVLAFVHLFALVLTIARGPWLGTAFAMAVLLVLAWMRLGAGLAARLAVVTGASAGAAILALSIPVGGARAPVDEPAAVMDSAAPVTQAAAPATQSTAVAYEEIGARLEGSSIAAGVSGRRTRWETSLRLLRDRPDLPLGSNRPWAVRSLVGYGPDSFRYAFPLEAPAALSTVLTTAAHNDPLTRAVELGLLGFIAYAALAAAAVAVLVSRFRLGAAGNVEAALLTGVAAALVGRFVEQQVGIAQVSDTLVFWLLMGLLAAAPAALAAPGAGQSRAAPPASASHALGLLAVSGVAALAIGVALLTWVKNVGYLQADHAASSARVLFGRDSGAALEVVERAISMAPDVPGYRHLKASMLRSVAAATTDPLRARTLIVEAYGSDREAFELNPFSRQASFILADSAWGLAQAGFPQGAVEALEAYERLARLSPQDPLVWDRLGRLYDALDVDPALRLAPH